jgi:hypothetical protein
MDHLGFLEKKEAEMAHQVNTKEPRKFAHGISHLSKAQMTAKKNPKRAASAQLMPIDVIAADGTECKVDTIPRVTDIFEINIADDESQME